MNQSNKQLKINPRNQQSNMQNPISDVIQSKNNSFEFQQESLNPENQRQSIIEKNLQLYKASLQLISRAYILTQQQSLSRNCSKLQGEINQDESGSSESNDSNQQTITINDLYYSQENLVKKQNKQQSLKNKILSDDHKLFADSRRLFIDGNVIFQNNKVDQAIHIMDISFEHQFIEQNLQKEDSSLIDKLEYTPITEQYFLNFMDQQVYRIIQNSIKKQHPNFNIQTVISDYVNVSSNWLSFIQRKMEENQSKRFQIYQELIEIDVVPFIEGNQVEHQIIQTFIENTMFGITFLKGQKNLNCLFFVHQQKENLSQIEKTKTKNKRVGPDQNYIRDVKDPSHLQLPQNEPNCQPKFSDIQILFEQTAKKKNRSNEIDDIYNKNFSNIGDMQPNKVASSEHEAFQDSKKKGKNYVIGGQEVSSFKGQIQGRQLSAQLNVDQFKLNSDIDVSKVIRKNQTIFDLQEQSQFYIKRNENMFINNKMDESISIGKDYLKQDNSKRYEEDIKELDSKLTTQKLFMNMVIHDLRNPAESIKQGLQQAKSLCQKEQNNIITDTYKVIVNNVLISKGKNPLQSNRSADKKYIKCYSPIMYKQKMPQKSEIKISQLFKLDNSSQKSVNYFKQDNRNLSKGRQQIIEKPIKQPKQVQGLINLNKWMPNQPDTPAVKSIFAATNAKENFQNDSPSFNRINDSAVGNQFQAFNQNKQIVQEKIKSIKSIELIQNQIKDGQEKSKKSMNSGSSSSNVFLSDDSELNQKKSVEEIKKSQSMIQDSMSSQKSQLKPVFSFGNLDNVQSVKIDKDIGQQNLQQNEFLAPPLSRKQLRQQCNQILEDSHEHRDSNSFSNYSVPSVTNQKSSSKIEYFEIESIKKQEEIKEENKEEKKEEIKEIAENEYGIFIEQPFGISRSQELQESEPEIDPFLDFDALEDDFFDELKCNTYNNDQILENPSGFFVINQPKNSSIKDNNFVLANKNTLKPAIQIVEKIVILKQENKTVFCEQGTQMEKVTCVNQEVQCDPEPEPEQIKKQNLEILEDGVQIEEDERQFLKELMKNKPNLKMMMANFKEFNQKLNFHKVPQRRSLTEKLINQNLAPKEEEPKLKQLTKRSIPTDKIVKQLLSNSDYQQPECRQCFKISKFMIKQLEKVLKLNLQMDQYMKNAIFSSMMMTNLINDLLDQAKLEQQTFQLDLDYFNLYEVITQAFQVLSFQADMKNIKFFLHFDKNKPYAFCKIFNDKRRLLQILLNFISNSLKFTSKNGFIKVHLFVVQEQNISQMQKSSNKSSIHSKKSQQYLKPNRSESLSNLAKQKVNLINGTIEIHKYMQIQIVVEDNGMGIKKENLGKLFMDYSKLDEHKKMNQKGTGLGLSICKNIINKMGGQVVVESTEGVGSKFIITIQVKAIDQTICNPEYIFMSESQKEKYNQESGTFNYFPEFNQKFNQIITETINHKDENKQQDKEDEDKTLFESKQDLVVYKFESNKINSQSIDDTKNFNILKDLREQLLTKQKQCSNSNLDSIDDIQSMDLCKRKSDLSDKFNKKVQERSLLRKQNFEIKGKDTVSAEHKTTSQKQLRKTEFPSRIESKKVPNKNVSQKFLQDYGDFENNYEPQNKNERSNISLEEVKVTIPQNNEESGFQIVQQQNKKNQIFKQMDISRGSNQSKESFGSAESNKGKNIKLIDQASNVAERKINCLVVNDEEFSLLIISSMLEGLSFIGKIEQASNGQEALEKVMYTERKFTARQYDIIFLDLDMPILNGYEACKKIKDFYQLTSIRNQANKASHNKQCLTSIQSKQIEIQRLRQMIDDYSHLYCGQNKHPQNDQIQFEKLIRTIYHKMKYWCLGDLKRPYIFAYSALINEETRQNTIEAGFDGCLISPITVECIKDLMTNFVDNYVNQFMSDRLLTISQFQILNNILTNNDQCQFTQKKRQSIIIEEMKECSDMASPNNNSFSANDKSQYDYMMKEDNSSLYNSNRPSSGKLSNGSQIIQKKNHIKPQN